MISPRTIITLLRRAPSTPRLLTPLLATSRPQAILSNSMTTTNAAPASGGLFGRRSSSSAATSAASTTTKADTSKPSEFYSLKADKPGGKVFDFADLQGKVVLIVNTASKCGFTPQYKGLEALHEKFSKDGLVILGFPCDQFGGQEPGNDDEILEACQLNHGVTFPLMKKSEVNGSNASAVFKYLKSQQGGILGSGIKWNFTKFLVDKQGRVVDRFAPTTTPESIGQKIAKMLVDPEARRGSL